MAKITSISWVEKDDPMFTGKFTVSSNNKKDKSKTTKEKVLDWVSEDDTSIKWPTKILKSGPNKGKKRICSEAYDMADAYVIGKSFLVEN